MGLRNTDLKPELADGEDCQWCGEPATNAVRLMSRRGKNLHTGQYVYSCDKHRPQADQAAQATIRETKK